MPDGLDEGGELPAGGGGAGGGGTENSGAAAGAETPLLSETARWRERAMELEAQLAESRAALAQAQAALEEARGALAQQQRRSQVERSLAEAGPIDPEAALILVEHALAGMEKPDVGVAVSQLRRARPWLFRPAGASASAGMGAAESEPAESAAREAAATGDRRAVLRYLRARRPR